MPAFPRLHRTKHHQDISLIIRRLSLFFLPFCWISAITAGLMMKGADWSERQLLCFRFPGDVFINGLCCLTLPLIMSSVIASIAAIDTRMSRKIGIFVFAYFFFTTLLAVILGIFLINVLQWNQLPLIYSTDNTYKTRYTKKVDDLLDLFRNLVPMNFIEACFYQYGTSLISPHSEMEYYPLNEFTAKRYPNHTKVIIESPRGKTKLILVERKLTPEDSWAIELQLIQNPNYLGIGFWAVLVGIAICHKKQKTIPLLTVVVVLNDILMHLTFFIEIFSPVGIFSIVLSKILEVDDLSVTVVQLSRYLGTILLGLFIHACIILTFLFSITTRKMPIHFIRAIYKALSTAFSTSSSIATMPTTMECILAYGIHPEVSNFIIPIGSIVNMNGSTFSEVVTALFVVQNRQINTNKIYVILVCLFATTATLGITGLPQGQVTTMIVVFNAIHLPVEDIRLILIVEWIVNRFRSVVNVYGDCVGAVVIDKLYDLL